MNENETGLISSLIQENKYWIEVHSMLKASDFIDINCRETFIILESLEGQADYLIVINKLKEGGKVDVAKFVEETWDCSVATHCLFYAKHIKISSTKRQLANLGCSIDLMLKEGKSYQEIVRETEGKLIGMYDTTDKNFESSRTIAIDYIKRMMKLQEQHLEISGLSSGFKSIDKCTDGLKEGELVFIGARPSIGKSSLMTQMALHIGNVLKKNVAIFSIESCTLELTHKFISQIAHVETWKLRRGSVDIYEQQKVNNALEMFSGSNIFVLDISTLDLLTIKAKIGMLSNMGFKPDIIFLDYLQMVQVEKGGYDSRAVKVGQIGRGFKTMAKNLNIPFVALVQLNRSDGDAPPRLASLKESGDLEQDADIVILLHREEQYKKEDCPQEKKGRIEIDICKNRNGPTMMLELSWQSEYTRIEE